MDYDTELQRFHDVLCQAAEVGPGDRVLDIGCGTGQTSRALAHAGSVLGVDISAAAVSRARALARDLPTVTFEETDAQVGAFPPGHFDLAVSRFGTMFFDDPVAAFTNIRRALRPGGHLAMLVWQSSENNEWAVAFSRALSVPRLAGPDPFALADPEPVLRAAGYAGITLTEAHEPIHFGPSVDAALEWVGGFTATRAALKSGDRAIADRLRETLEAHLTADGVWFDARAWLVTARGLGT